MKQDVNWGMVSDSFDPIALFKLIKKFVLKQLDNQYKTAVLMGKGYFVLLAVCSAICPAAFGHVLPFCMGQNILAMNGLFYDIHFANEWANF
jgi:hypothetical protein